MSFSLDPSVDQLDETFDLDEYDGLRKGITFIFITRGFFFGCILHKFILY